MSIIITLLVTYFHVHKGNKLLVYMQQILTIVWIQSRIFYITLNNAQSRPNIPSARDPQQNDRDQLAHTSAALLWTCRIALDHSMKFMADRMWDDQQSSHCEPSCFSSWKFFLTVELLLWVKAFYCRTAARNQLNCRGSSAWCTVQRVCPWPP